MSSWSLQKWYRHESKITHTVTIFIHAHYKCILNMKSNTKWTMTQTNPTHCACVCNVSFACLASSDFNCFSCVFSCLYSFVIAVFRLRCLNVDVVYIWILYSTPSSVVYIRGSRRINISLLLLIIVKYSIVIIDNSHTIWITSFFLL